MKEQRSVMQRQCCAFLNNEQRACVHEGAMQRRTEQATPCTAPDSMPDWQENTHCTGLQPISSQNLPTLAGTEFGLHKGHARSMAGSDRTEISCACVE
eukprot:1146105-Pelagomonas_calceolata.AAC.2